MEPRWEPDANMVDAVKSTPKSSWKMTDLSGPDRSWLVAGLTLAGVTAQDIADKMGCSLRLVRTIRAEDMTQVCYLAQQQLTSMADDLRQAELAQRLTERELAAANEKTGRVQGQLDDVLDALSTGEVKGLLPCGHVNAPFNVYENRGRTFCRKCGCDRLKKWRNKPRPA